MSWSDDRVDQRTAQRSFQSTVRTAMHFLIPRFALPGWLLHLTKKVYIPKVTAYVQGLCLAFDDLKLHILDLIHSARDSASGDKDMGMGGALLNSLIDAAAVYDEDNVLKRLTDDEVVADLFVRLRCSKTF